MGARNPALILPHFTRIGGAPKKSIETTQPDACRKWRSFDLDDEAGHEIGVGKALQVPGGK
jgi:hypothetical protein